MSFVKTLATLAVGFVAARGVDKFQKMGGLAGVKDALADAGKPGGIGDQMGAMAEKIGVPGGRETVRKMMETFGTGAASVTGQAEAGLGGLLSAMTGVAAAGARNASTLVEALAGTGPAGEMVEADARLMIRAMIQAAKADGTIDAAERAAILDHLTDAGEEELAFVQAAFDAPVDPLALARDVGEEARVRVYGASLMVMTADTEAERAYLKTLAMALQLDEATVAETHTRMGKPLV